MKICHIAPFAPFRCGLYEACRDMVRSDIDMGLDVILVDAGITENGIRQEGKIGEVDNRYDFELITSDPKEINTCDIVVCHTGVPDHWLVTSQIPLIWVIHGRPRACYIPEFNGFGNSYTLINNVSNWSRTKKVIHFWAEFEGHWKHSIPTSKHAVMSTPCYDLNRTKVTEKYEIQNKGDINVLIAESHREDIDIYETIIQVLNNDVTGVKYHFFAVEKFDEPIHQFLFGTLNEQGKLGDIHARVTNMELVYNSMDILLSPQKIVTRSVLEAHYHGLKIIGDNKLANLKINFDDPYSLRENWNNTPTNKYLETIYKKEMMKIYEEVCK